MRVPAEESDIFNRSAPERYPNTIRFAEDESDSPSVAPLTRAIRKLTVQKDLCTCPPESLRRRARAGVSARLDRITPIVIKPH